MSLFLSVQTSKCLWIHGHCFFHIIRIMLTYTCRITEVTRSFVFTAVIRRFLKILSLPRSKHSPSRIQNPVYKRIIVIYSDNYTIHINARCEQDVEFLMKIWSDLRNVVLKQGLYISKYFKCKCAGRNISVVKMMHGINMNKYQQLRWHTCLTWQDTNYELPEDDKTVSKHLGAV
jgi:hypothetical protein